MGATPSGRDPPAAQRRRRYQANDDPGGSGFVIAGPKGTVGVLARRPFAPNCIRQAEEGPEHVEKQSGERE